MKSGIVAIKQNEREATKDESFWPLVVEAKIGSIQAVEALFRHKKMKALMGLIVIRWKRDGNQQDYRNEEDFQQDIAMLVYQNITGFRGEREDQFWGYIWSIVRNKNFDYGRSFKKEAPVEKQGLDGIEKGSRESQFDKVLLQECWSSLNEQQKSILRLHVDGYKLEEIAKRLGKSKSSVHRVLKETQKNLWEKLYGWKPEIKETGDVRKKLLFKEEKPWKRKVKIKMQGIP